MSHVIYSENFLTVCAILAKGDLNVSFENVIKSAEKYGRFFKRQFGISVSDFRSSIINLFFLHSGRKVEDFLEDMTTGEISAEISLKEGIPYLSKFREVLFNDEGESFLEFETFLEPYSEEDRLSRMKANREIWNFFTFHSESSPEEIISFIENYSDYVFFEHPGDFRENDPNLEVFLELIYSLSGLFLYL
ncbi:MAG: hypothetical protein K9I71_13255 [Ignavibacteriales bacterium]|nr:hypothetical protein [Ignavibacteriales bacterium]MCF8432700.1 hypothetical protein [Melioribacteraceae bacterium]